MHLPTNTLVPFTPENTLSAFPNPNSDSDKPGQRLPFQISSPKFVTHSSVLPLTFYLLFVCCDITIICFPVRVP